VDGVQYVAVQSGWGVDAQRMQDKLDEIHGAKTHVPQGGRDLGVRRRAVGDRRRRAGVLATVGVPARRHPVEKIISYPAPSP
jgi:hypothetical protein